MNFNTEVNLDMTVRITGRDQVTGVDLLKLNALFKAVEDMGGTITLPNPIPANPDFINCTYDANMLSYTGGTVDIGNGVAAGLVAGFNFPVGATVTFELNKPSHEQMFLSFGTEATHTQSIPNEALTVGFMSPQALTLQILEQGNFLDSVSIAATDIYKIVATKSSETTVSLSFYDSQNAPLKTYEAVDISTNRIWLAVALASQESVFTANIQVATQAET